MRGHEEDEWMDTLPPRERCTFDGALGGGAVADLSVAVCLDRDEG